MRLFLLTLLISINLTGIAQQNNANSWADSVYKSLSNDERIAQLIVTRLSSMDVKTKKITFLYDQVAELVKKYNIGGVCVFQGSPVLQAGYLNNLQAMAKTPILVSIDAEWGVGMRIIDSVAPLPKQMMLGAVKDATIIYRYGQIVAEQCKRMGIQMNYAPVMDVNNNPENPVINDRSFGEDKYKVALFGTQYMKGMQESGVMACAKHFPGHGDVAVDSHYDLPVINKSMTDLDSLEMYPFRQIFKEGVGSVMIAHLFIPSIDKRKNRPTSLSASNIKELMRSRIGYQGLTITDGLEMQGVKKFFPDGESSVESLIAGNDLLCLPDNIPLVIKKIKEAIDKKRLSWEEIEQHCKKVLRAKYEYGLTQLKPINTENLTADLNKDIPAMRRLVAENAITLLSKKDSIFFPLKSDTTAVGEVAYVGVGLNTDNAFAARMRRDHKATVYYFDYSKKSKDSMQMMLDKIVMQHKKIIIGIHNINRAPANNFGISSDAVYFINLLQQRSRSAIFLFGNAYAAKNWCLAKNLAVCYEDDSIVQETAADILQGKIPYKGTLPVSVCEGFSYGQGIVTTKRNSLENISLAEAGFTPEKLINIDSIANDAISKKAMPGCVLLVTRNGKIVLEKTYGHYTYEKKQPVTFNAVFDLASITKILATTVSLMKLYDEGKLDLKKKLSDYLPSVKGTNKENLLIEKLLLHEVGLQPFTPFYKETLDKNGRPLKQWYAGTYSKAYPKRVAAGLFASNALEDSFYRRILESPLSPEGTYVYSDNDFIFLGKIIESISGLSLDQYVKKNFYEPMQLESIGFNAHKIITPDRIVPTEIEAWFRTQEINGDVHDPGASLMNGVSGHAGLFSDAYDVACMMQMLLNNGNWDGKRYLEENTVKLFTAYGSAVSRRGLGFDKPEKNNDSIPEPYPALSASALTFGHTGFTGTCAWADPEKKLVFILLSNRTHPSRNKIFSDLNVRGKLLEAVYQSFIKSDS
jgi:beta-N-acetylhexosaminidase